ncbi:hypothetical protein BKA69DRAFT_1048891 [Paraphysoderma sedebokerense]|nr:hypothetical protein BKA69DRAFT_1048891 [Paraphysoderma sedebokerense]
MPAVEGNIADIEEQFFAAIKANDPEKVRNCLTTDKTLATKKKKTDFKFPSDLELESYKFLGAYLGQCTGLHMAILYGHDAIARDIIERTFKEDLDERLGGNNTALHLAAFMTARETVKLLLERGADRTIKNGKGFSPVDVADDVELSKIFAQ